MDVKITSSWKSVLQEEFEKSYFKSLVSFLKNEKRKGKIIFPKGEEIFNAFELTPFENVNVVILGQDPYHGHGQAHGLCFSVKDGVKPPPSLVNIFKEINQDLNFPIPTHGNLTSWAKQGILLLNASLTVEEAQPMSHSKIGWEQFTDAVIKIISEKKDGVVFVLWGRFAQQKESLIDSSKHFILKSAHPSPLSAHNGFLGNKHFSKINLLLKEKGKEPINWKL